MSCSRTCWTLGGAWFQCSYGGFWMSFCQLMAPGDRRFLVISSFGFRPPASGFQSYSYKNSLRLLHSYSTDGKTSRLMAKRFSVRDSQRGSQSYMKKRRGRWEIEVTTRKRGGIKRGESSLASNKFPICSPQSGTPKEIHRVK